MGCILLTLSLKSGLLWCAIVPIILHAKFQSPFNLSSLHKIAFNLPNCFYLKLCLVSGQKWFFSPRKTMSEIRPAKVFIHTTLTADTREELVLHFCIFPSHFWGLRNVFSNQSSGFSSPPLHFLEPAVHLKKKTTSPSHFQLGHVSQCEA